MEKHRIYTAIGLMSGTSMDGVDLALIRSDGCDFIERKNFAYFPYDAEIKNSLQSLIYAAPSLMQIKIIENEFTLLNAEIVNNFIAQSNIDINEIDWWIESGFKQKTTLP